MNPENFNLDSIKNIYEKTEDKESFGKCFEEILTDFDITI